MNKNIASWRGVCGLLMLGAMVVSGCKGTKEVASVAPAKQSGVSVKAAQGPRTYDSVKGLVMAGYQGWFNADGDGEGREFYHYAGHHGFRPGSTKVDMWPYTAEYTYTYPTEFSMADGSPAVVFSSADPSTVATHFKWMKDYGLDGVYMQRFIAELKREGGRRHFNRVLKNAMNSAIENERAIAVMYDLSGMESEDADIVINDAAVLAEVYHMFNRSQNPSYLYHNGKPLIAVWGIGFDDRRHYTVADCERIVDALKEMGFSVLVGVPTYWREHGSDTLDDPRLHELIKKSDVLMPWFVGRYTFDSFDGFKGLVADDLQWCRENGVDYMPLAYPGFSWVNMAGPNSLQIPRRKGEFFQKQIDNVFDSGCESMYIAMFDEIDEGTAIFKCATEVPIEEKGTKFVAIEPGVAPDHYLKLAGNAAKRMKAAVK